MHQLAWSNYQNRKRSISVAGRCITRIERRAESPTYLHEQIEKEREREQERERERERIEAKNEAHPPKGPVPLLTPYVPRRLNVPFTRR